MQVNSVVVKNNVYIVYVSYTWKNNSLAFYHSHK